MVESWEDIINKLLIGGEKSISQIRMITNL